MAASPVRRPTGVAGQPAQHDEAEGQDDGGRCRRRRRRGGGDQEAAHGRSGDPSQRLGGGQQAVGRGEVRRRHRRRDEGVEGRVHRGGRGRGQEGDDGEDSGRCTDGDTGGDTDREEDAGRRRGLEDAPVAPPVRQDSGHGGQQQVGQQPGAGRHRRPQWRSGLVVERDRQGDRSMRPAPPRRGCRTRARDGTIGCPARPGRCRADQPRPSCPSCRGTRYAERAGRTARFFGTPPRYPSRCTAPPDVGDLPCWHARGRCRAMTRIKTAALAVSDEALRLGHEAQHVMYPRAA